MVERDVLFCNLNNVVMLSSMLSCWLSQDVSRAKLAAIIPDPVVAPSIVPVLKDEVDRKPEYPKPDTQQMIPFQPRHLARKSDVQSAAAVVYPAAGY